MLQRQEVIIRGIDEKTPGMAGLSVLVIGNGRFECEQVGVCPESRNLSAADRSNKALVPEFLACVNVREVNFNRWHLNGGDGVAQRDTGVRVRCGIEDDPIKLALGILNPTYQLAFDIRLAKLERRRGAQLAGALANAGLDFRERRAPVLFRLTRPQQVQVRPIEVQDSHWRAGRYR